MTAKDEGMQSEWPAFTVLDGRGAPADEPVPRIEDHVQSGQLLACSGSRVVRTVLGSCVAVCLWDEWGRVGGMNHFLLPAGGPGAELKYGAPSMARLLEETLRLGGVRGRLRAKVFGGASVVASLAATGGHLGRCNADTALDFLAKERIPVVAADICGGVGRTLVLRLPDGATWVRLLGTMGAVEPADTSRRIVRG